MSEFLVELKLIKFGTPGHFQNLLVDSFLSSETWDLCLWLKEVPVCSSFSTFSVTTFSASHNRCQKLKYPDIRGHHLQLVEQSGVSWISRLFYTQHDESVCPSVCPSSKKIQPRVQSKNYIPRINTESALMVRP